MATSSVATAQTTAAQTETVSPSSADAVQVPGISRREFLYYAWTASLALSLAETTGMIIWFALPRFRAGEFGGVFTLSGTDLPALDDAPSGIPSGKFWLSNSSEGIVALYMVCTHLGCLYKWVPANHRFECPCHGSKYELAGQYIEGPAPRSLDRFEITITTKGGQSLITDPTGDPVKVDPASVQTIDVNTGKRIKRSGRI